eukprot:Phypoly_transcript_07592.p1 GENE.Phypoly_transcript_07592~~Phypoly_transcript_07592.p1  ORF type:complete len:444 (+),score=71.06 Phypoly_transcript_07592:210-1541(+)
MQVVKESEKKIYPLSSHPSHTWAASVNDILMPPVNIRWIAFYEKTNKGDQDFMSPEHLEKSLAKVLDLYPLLAGRWVQLPLGHYQFEYNQNDLQGCSFTVATANFSLAALRQANFPQSQIPDELKPGTPFPTPEAPLFAAQVTRLTCGSVVMGYSMSHKIGDGYSVHHFVEKWSRVARKLDVERPLLDRSVLRPDSSPLVDSHPEYYTTTTPPAHVPIEAKRLVLTFSPEKVAELKSAANAGLAAGRWVSTNDAIVTLVWRVLTRARGLGAGVETACGIAIDGRKRWETTLGDMAQYFGNFVTYPRISSDAASLTNSTLGTAALLIREHVEKMNRARFQSSLNWLDRVVDKTTIQGNFKFDKDIFISSWQTFPIYDCDFGWGKPTKALLHAFAMDGICLVLPRGPANDADINGLEVHLDVATPNVEKVAKDPELTRFAAVVID